MQYTLVSIISIKRLSICTVISLHVKDVYDITETLCDSLHA